MPNDVMKRIRELCKRSKLFKQYHGIVGDKEKNKGIPGLKEKYFNQTPVNEQFKEKANEYWNNLTANKSYASVKEYEKIQINNGIVFRKGVTLILFYYSYILECKIPMNNVLFHNLMFLTIFLDPLTIEKQQTKVKVSSSPELRRQKINKLIWHLERFIEVCFDSDSGLSETSCHVIRVSIKPNILK